MTSSNHSSKSTAPLALTLRDALCLKPSETVFPPIHTRLDLDFDGLQKRVQALSLWTGRAARVARGRQTAKHYALCCAWNRYQCGFGFATKECITMNGKRQQQVVQCKEHTCSLDHHWEYYFSIQDEYQALIKEFRSDEYDSEINNKNNNKNNNKDFFETVDSFQDLKRIHAILHDETNHLAQSVLSRLMPEKLAHPEISDAESTHNDIVLPSPNDTSEASLQSDSSQQVTDNVLPTKSWTGESTNQSILLSSSSRLLTSKKRRRPVSESTAPRPVTPELNPPHNRRDKKMNTNRSSCDNMNSDDNDGDDDNHRTAPASCFSSETVASKDRNVINDKKNNETSATPVALGRQPTLQYSLLLDDYRSLVQNGTCLPLSFGTTLSSAKRAIVARLAALQTSLPCAAEHPDVIEEHKELRRCVRQMRRFEDQEKLMVQQDARDAYELAIQRANARTSTLERQRRRAQEAAQKAFCEQPIQFGHVPATSTATQKKHKQKRTQQKKKRQSSSRVQAGSSPTLVAQQVPFDWPSSHHDLVQLDTLTPRVQSIDIFDLKEDDDDDDDDNDSLKKVDSNSSLEHELADNSTVALNILLHSLQFVEEEEQKSNTANRLPSVVWAVVGGKRVRIL